MAECYPYDVIKDVSIRAVHPYYIILIHFLPRHIDINNVVIFFIQFQTDSLIRELACSN